MRNSSAAILLCVITGSYAVVRISTQQTVTGTLCLRISTGHIPRRDQIAPNHLVDLTDPDHLPRDVERYVTGE